ncbi:hemerythrin domain-containing protein [Nitrosococcus wardiae]|uniref:Hemerythrin domain-containing protein n=1 Tax=Nitrosococcus wardiae TaxID=1814290 RepID=A0A4V1AW54_9GAMM|nr:hemerythrin domain-containing protein [Nitrosococcus wardiae]QBQ55445.1 hemerythrin domain-containing protein [Nitrosococcus wardiae]
MDAIQLLKIDHDAVKALLNELASTTKRAEKKRQDLLARIGKEIEIHTRVEEEIFYPAIKKAGKKVEDERLYFEALEEHRAVGELVLPDLQATSPATDQFSGRAKVLKELVEHHADEEEKKMFPRAKELLSKEDLVELAKQIQARKAELGA